MVELFTSNHPFCTNTDLKCTCCGSYSRIGVNLNFGYTCYSQANQDTWHFSIESFSCKLQPGEDWRRFHLLTRRILCCV